MKSPKKRSKFYLLLYGSFLVVEMALIKYFNFEIEQVFPVVGIVSMFISFIILMFEMLSLVKFIKDNYIKELEKIIPKDTICIHQIGECGLHFQVKILEMKK